MPNTGNFYIATLKKTHLGWGTHRTTNSRPKIKNEGYIPIPSKYAFSFNITRCALYKKLLKSSKMTKLY